MADLGDTLRFSSDVRDPDGELVNAADVALTITLPDGTTAAAVVTDPPAVTGKYVHDFVTSTSGPAGRYVGQWLFTFGNGTTTSYVESFDVSGPTLVTVDEALAYLRAAGTITGQADLDQLQELCAAATDMVERDLGRVMVPRAFTETYLGGQGTLLLRNTPVISVTSVTEGVSLVAGTDYYVLPGSGVLYRGVLDGWRGTFASGVVTVVYVAGYTDPPWVARLRARQFVQALWQTSQQAPHPFVDESSPEAFTSTGLVPPEPPGYSSLRAVGIA